MTRSAATLGQVVQAAIQSRKFRTSTQQSSKTTKPTPDRIAIEKNLGANRAHCSLRASIGATLEARRAGRKPAPTATAEMTAIASANATTL